MNAIDFLKKEHSRFRKMLRSISNMSEEKSKLKKFNILSNELIRHETMEQKVWYPKLRKQSELRKIIKHLVSEEKTAEKAIKKFKKTEFGLIWKLKYFKLKHDIEHHANEEEKELFPKVRKFFNKTELNELGKKLQKFKKSHV